MEYTHGGDIYTYKGMLDFSANINPLGPSYEVMEAVKDAAGQIGVYPDSRCRKLISSLEGTLGISGEMIIPGNGAADILFTLMLAEHPKKAVVTVPSFQEYEKALKACGCQVIYHYLKEEEDFALTENYLENLREDVDMIFLCSPDNPSGQVIDTSLLKEIAKRCQKYKIRMVLDQCFCEFMEKQEDVLETGVVLHNPYIFLLRAFTKMHAVPGLRLGYGICSDRGLMERLESARQPWSVSVTAQAAGIAALNQPERVEETRNYVKARKREMERELKKMGICYFPSKANYILLKSRFALFELLKEKQILIRDCSNYKGLAEGYYRIAVKKKEENQKLLKALGEIIRKGERRS